MNKPLLKQTLDHIKANPESWDQSRWFCGTAACFAGHACLLSGDRPGPEIPNPFFDTPYSVDILTSDGDQKFTQDRAEELLGISQREANFLFYQDNRLGDLERMVDNLLNDRHIVHGFSDDDRGRLYWDEYEDGEDDGYDETSWSQSSQDDEDNE